MYCTGGVRCERASVLLKSKYGDKVKGVYQLNGGEQQDGYYDDGDDDGDVIMILL